MSDQVSVERVELSISHEEALVIHAALHKRFETDDLWDPTNPLDCAMNGLFCELQGELGDAPLWGRPLRKARTKLLEFYSETDL